MNFNTLELDLRPKQLQNVSPPKGAEGLRTKVMEGDFLFSITGYLGMFAIAPLLDESYVNQHIALARPVGGFSKQYFGYYTISHVGGIRHLNRQTKGAVKAGLGLDDIRNYPVPMCSLPEQEQIVQKLESRLSEIDNLDQTITTALQQSEALRQSILKKAFSGQLVPQDPNDEPAAELLARIKEERADVNPKTKNGRVADRAPKKTRRTKAIS
jgi:type I restriction enzyme S subunit